MQGELEQLKGEWDQKLQLASKQGDTLFNRGGSDESQLEALMNELKDKQHLLSDLESQRDELEASLVHDDSS